MQSSLTVYYLRYTSDYVGQTITCHRSKSLLLWWSDRYIWTNLISEHPGHIDATSTLSTIGGSFKRVEDGVHVAMPRPADRRGRLPNFPLSVPQYNEEFSKNSLCEAGRHPRQGNLLTIPYMHMCSHCNLQVTGCRSSCPAPSADEMDYEKQVRSVHDRDDSS